MQKRAVRPLLMKTLVVTVATAAAVCLLELWLHLFGEEVFIKILVTCGVVAAAAGVLLAIFTDLEEDVAHKKDNYLN